MSLQENTINLEEVLQKVRALPIASGSSSGSGKELIGEFEIGSSNLTSNNDGSYRTNAELQTAIENVFLKLNEGVDVLAVEFSLNDEKISGTCTYSINAQDPTTGLIDFKQMYSEDEINYFIITPSHIKSDAPLDMATFTVKFYAISGGSGNSNSVGSSTGKLVGEVVLTKSDLISDGNSQVMYNLSESKSEELKAIINEFSLKKLPRLEIEASPFAFSIQGSVTTFGTNQKVLSFESAVDSGLFFTMAFANDNPEIVVDGEFGYIMIVKGLLDGNYENLVLRFYEQNSGGSSSSSSTSEDYAMVKKATFTDRASLYSFLEQKHSSIIKAFVKLGEMTTSCSSILQGRTIAGEYAYLFCNVVLETISISSGPQTVSVGGVAIKVLKDMVEINRYIGITANQSGVVSLETSDEGEVDLPDQYWNSEGVECTLLYVDL